MFYKEGSSPIIREQLFKNGWLDLKDCWGEFQSEILLCDDIAHFWSNKDFRWGFQRVLNFNEILEDKCAKEKHPSFSFMEFVNEMCQDEEGVDMLTLLLKASQIMEKSYKPGQEQERMKKVHEDLRYLILYAEMFKQCDLLDEFVSGKLKEIGRKIIRYVYYAN